MKFQVERNSSVPIAQQLEASLRAWIEQHNLVSGSRLPSIRQLASTHHISRNAVIEAYERLAAVGLVRSKPGAGFYVADSIPPTSQYSSHPLKEITNGLWGVFNADERSLNLGCGWLPSQWREHDDLTYAIRQVTRMRRADILEYSTPQGTANFRNLLQKRLRLLAINVDAHQLVSTDGSSQSLDLILRLLTEPDDVVFVESPGYYNLFGLLHLQRVRAVGVPRLADGPDVAYLEALLTKYRPKLFYINSVFHNPTGSTLTPTVAHHLLQLADRYDFQIIEDDIYADFQHTPTTRLAALDGLNRVIYLGGFSKSLSSSLRIGFIAAPTSLVQRIVDIKMLTSISSSRFSEQVVSTMLQNGSYRRLTERLATVLAKQMTTALSLLKKAEWEVFTEPTGGMFLWVKPPDTRRKTIETTALASGVTLAPGHLFRVDNQPTPWLRLNVAYIEDPRARAFIEGQ